MQIGARFNGPPSTGHGGFSSGAFARAAGLQDATVTLRRPPPLDRELDMRRAADADVFFDGELEIARVTAAQLHPLDPPFTATPDEATIASKGYRGFTDHPFPTCFACGPARDDGLALFPGPFAGGAAAPWTPDPSVCDGDTVWPEAVAAALDCPSAWGALDQSDDAPYVLGTMTIWQAPVAAGAQMVVVSWPVSREGPRKMHAGSALLDASGACLVRARTTWIRLRT